MHCDDSTPPLPWASATAPSTWRSPHSPRSWRTASIDREQPVHAGMAVGEAAAVGVDRELCRRARCAPSATNAPAFALGAEAEVLEEQDRGDSEGVVELRRTSMSAGRQAGHRRRPAAPESVAAVTVRSGICGDVAVPVRLAAPSSRRAASGGPRARSARRHDERAAAVGDQAAVAHGRAGRRPCGRRARPRSVSSSRDHAPGSAAPTARAATATSASCSRRGAELVHVAGRGQRVGGHRERRAVRRLVRVELLHGGAGTRRPSAGCSRRAISATSHSPASIAARRVPQVRDERGAADLGGVGVARPDAEVLAGAERRHRQLGRRRRTARRRRRPQTALVQRAGGGLGDQVLRAVPGGDLAEVGLGDAGDGDGSNTGIPSSKSTRTRMPISTTSGADPAHHPEALVEVDEHDAARLGVALTEVAAE